jgi:hypothetical protein
VVGSLALILAACSPRGSESRIPGEITDSGDSADSGTEPTSDLDADGWTAADGDCDDGSADVHPGAYDRPDDGVDGDCDGKDRTCDCLVLDGGRTTAEPYAGFDLSSLRTLDLAYLLAPGTWDTSPRDAARDSFADVVAAVGSEFGSVTFGVAMFDDYAYAPAGGAEVGETPFQLRQQQTDDVDAVHDALVNFPPYGGDGVQSGFEGLYQALSGAGYDQDCDASFDDSEDVLPFLAAAADPFAGTAGQSFDTTDDSTGAVGGMGFRADAAVRVLVYSTGANLRDPARGFPSPGGCAFDAASSDVVAAVLDAKVWLVAIESGTTATIPDMEDLADETGSAADVDSDGTDELLVYDMIPPDPDTFRDAVLDALDAIRIASGLPDAYQSLSVEVRDDPLGIVSAVSPESFDDVPWDDVPSLSFAVDYDTSAYGAKPVVGSVDFALVGDGVDLLTFHVDVEIAPL